MADQVLADLPPCQMAITDSYSDSSYLADQMLADLPPAKQQLSIPTLTAYIRQTKCWQIYPLPPNPTVIIDAYSDSSY